MRSDTESEATVNQSEATRAPPAALLDPGLTLPQGSKEMLKKDASGAIGGAT